MDITKQLTTKLICPKCGSKNVYSHRDGKLICRKCAHVEPAPKENQPK